MQHRLPQSHILFKGFIFTSTSLLFAFPDIVIICSPLNDFHVLIDSNVSVLNSSLNLNWFTTYLEFIAKGCQGVCLRKCFGIGSSKIGEHGSFGEIKDNGVHREEGGKIENRRWSLHDSRGWSYGPSLW